MTPIADYRILGDSNYLGITWVYTYQLVMNVATSVALLLSQSQHFRNGHEQKYQIKC